MSPVIHHLVAFSAWSALGIRSQEHGVHPAVSSKVNAVPTYVATSTPLAPEPTNSHVIDGRLVDFVRHLKGRSGGDIGVHGSISVTRTPLAAHPA